jgi:signal transduction histidine kinase/ligand-binding sensor domain-containing protein
MGWWSEPLRRAVAAAALAIACCTSHGQVAVMEPYQESAGLTNMAVACLVQTADGTLWIGTDNGLFSFDGFRVRREVTPPAAGPGITDLQADQYGRLWVATETGLFLRRERGGLPHWSAVVRPDGIGLGVEGKQRLTVDQHGNVFAMDRRSRIWTIPVPSTDSSRLEAAPLAMPAFEPFHGAYDAAGGPIQAIGPALWFGCGRGLCRWLAGQLQAWGPGRGLPVDTWASVVAAHDGSLWARGVDHIARLPPGSERFESVEAPTAKLWPATIATSQDPAGRIITATDDGLARWDGHAWQRWTPREGIPETAVRALLVDADGELWIGSAGRGLSRWIGYGRFDHWTTATGLPSPVVWAFARDGAGRLLVSTSKGVAALDPTTQRFSAIAPVFAPFVGGGLAVDAGGTAWWVDGGHVLALPAGARRAREMFRDPRFQTATKAAHSIVLSGSQAAERLVDSPGAPRREALPPGMPDPDSLIAVVSDGQREWFLIGKGAYRIEGGRWEPMRTELGTPVEVRMAGTFTNPSEFWAADMHGLSIYQVSGSVARLKERIDSARLGTGSIVFLHGDRQGRMWIGTDHGVHVRTGTHWTLLNRDNGLLWNDLDSGAVFQDTDGAMWLGSSMGATRVAPALLEASAPSLRVEDIRFGDGPWTALPPPRVPWDDRRMRLTLRTPQIARGRSMRLEYRIGETRPWEAFDGNVLQIESLEPGDYRLQVHVAANGPLGQAGPPAEVAFTIEPPWWRSMPARVAYLVMLAAAWLLSMHVLRARARATRTRLEKAIAERTAELEHSRELVRSLGVHNARSLEEERKRVARELHDEMGQQLAALRMELSVLRRRAPDAPCAPDDSSLATLMGRVDGLVASMRGVVAQLRPPALDGGLVVAFDWLHSEFARHTQVHCDIDVDKSLLRLPPETATMVFRVAQESLNNVRRHAGASRVRVQLREFDRQGELSVADDGVGFDVTAHRPGYGVLGMEERARALGGKLTLESVPGRGTTVRLRFPLPPAASDAC